MFTDFKGTFPQVTVFSLSQIPIANPSNEKSDRMVSLTERMLNLYQQLIISNNPNEKTLLQRQIEITDHQIDTLVYELYGLTNDEISLVEGEII